MKFISYTGGFPNLCSGILTVEINGKKYRIKNGLVTTGSISFKNGDESIAKGEWRIKKEKVPVKIRSYFAEIEKLANENIPFGCCGGCV